MDYEPTNCPDNTYFVDPNKRECVKCSSFIPGCATCSISGTNIKCLSNIRKNGKVRGNNNKFTTT